VNSFLTKLMTGNNSGALLLTTFELNRRGAERRQRSVYLFGAALRLSLAHTPKPVEIFMTG